jgi:hypothetical protein
MLIWARVWAQLAGKKLEPGDLLGNVIKSEKK